MADDGELYSSGTIHFGSVSIPHRTRQCKNKKEPGILINSKFLLVYILL